MPNDSDARNQAANNLDAFRRIAQAQAGQNIWLFKTFVQNLVEIFEQKKNRCWSTLKS